jgi:hypothetical protein
VRYRVGLAATKEDMNRPLAILEVKEICDELMVEPDQVASTQIPPCVLPRLQCIIHHPSLQ